MALLKYGAQAFVSLSLYVVLCCGVKGDNRRNLNIFGCLPMTGKLWPGGGACLPAMLLAVDMVNGRDDILRDYNLQFNYMDCMCDPGVNVDRTYNMLYTPPVKHFIVGPGCSVAAEAVATSTHMWNITHLSWGGASPLLSDRERFPKFFRISVPDTHFNVARMALMRFFNWKKIALIDAALDYIFAVTADFLDTVETTAPEIHIISQEIFNRDSLQRIQYLKDQDARIIIGGGYAKHARAILCAAYQVGLYGPKVVWIFPGWFTDYWWRDDIEELSCTSDQMDRAAEGHLLTSFPFFNPDEEQRGISGMNVREFREQFKGHPLYQPDQARFDFASAQSFDSILGAALALNCTDAYLKQIGHSKSLADFQYSDGDIGDVITECTHKLKFLGISGTLDMAAGSVKPVEIEQIYNLERRHVAMFHTEKTVNNSPEWHIDWMNGGILWKNGYAPRDSTQIIIVEITVPPYLYVVMSSLAFIGILTSITLIVFNVYHMTHVTVKLSSPNINTVLLLGCACAYSTVFMQSYSSEKVALCKVRHGTVKLSSPNINTVLLLGCACAYSTVFMQSYSSEKVALCKIRALTLTVGFSMAFGAMFSKTWRVHRIFANKKLLRTKLRDRQLIAPVGVLVAILTTLHILHEIIDPLGMEKQLLKSEVNVKENDLEIQPYVRLCVSRYHGYFSWTIYGVEGLLLIFGTFLSVETRKVRIATLNDSQQIGLCIYNVVVLATLGLTLSLALDTHVALVYGITSGFIILGTTATQLIVFFPKIMSVYYPHAQKQHTRNLTLNGLRGGTTTSTNAEMSECPAGSGMCDGTVFSIGKPGTSENKY